MGCERVLALFLASCTSLKNFFFSTFPCKRKEKTHQIFPTVFWRFGSNLPENLLLWLFGKKSPLWHWTVFLANLKSRWRSIGRLPNCWPDSMVLRLLLWWSPKNWTKQQLFLPWNTNWVFTADLLTLFWFAIFTRWNSQNCEKSQQNWWKCCLL